MTDTSIARQDQLPAETENQPQASPEAHKMTLEELNEFAPKCTYCGGPINWERAKRRKRTCSDEHTKMMGQYRRHLQSMTRCPSCSRPSTPEERKDYKAWRAHRGDLMNGNGRGRPSTKREKELATGIEKLHDELVAQVESEENYTPNARDLIYKLAAMLLQPKSA